MNERFNSQFVSHPSWKVDPFSNSKGGRPLEKLASKPGAGNKAHVNTTANLLVCRCSSRLILSLFLRGVCPTNVPRGHIPISIGCCLGPLKIRLSIPVTENRDREPSFPPFPSVLRFFFSRIFAVLRENVTRFCPHFNPYRFCLYLSSRDQTLIACRGTSIHTSTSSLPSLFQNRTGFTEMELSTSASFAAL